MQQNFPNRATFWTHNEERTKIHPKFSNSGASIKILLFCLQSNRSHHHQWLCLSLDSNERDLDIPPTPLSWTYIIGVTLISRRYTGSNSPYNAVKQHKRKTAQNFSINRVSHIKTDVNVSFLWISSKNNNVLQAWKHLNTNQKRFFHSRTVHPDIIKTFIYPTECTTRLKFTLKFLH
jgi:hypothetical protein